MTQTDKDEFLLWQRTIEMNMSSSSFEDFRKPENEASRDLNFPF